MKWKHFYVGTIVVRKRNLNFLLTATVLWECPGHPYLQCTDSVIVYVMCIHVHVMYIHVFCMIQRFMSSREVDLTEEEKLTLKAEGLPIPTTLPLTKVHMYIVRYRNYYVHVHV